MFLGLAWLSKWTVDMWFADLGLLVQFVVGGALYVFFVSLVTIVAPYFSGLKAQDVLTAFQYLRYGAHGEPIFNGELPGFGESKPELQRPFKIAILGAGNSIHTRRWVNSLAERGHTVHLISLHKVEGVNLPPSQIHQLSFSAPWGYVLNSIRVRRILKEVSPDLFHVHYASGYGTLGTLSMFQPRIVSVWGQDIFNFPYESIYSRILILLNLRTANWICSTSRVMALQTVRVLKSTVGRISVTPFGVDTDVFLPRDSVRERLQTDIVVGTVKTLSPKYGIDTLIQGFAQAREQLLSTHPEHARRMKLRIVGGGEGRAPLEALVEKSGIRDVTTFVGFVDHLQVPAELKKLDIYVAMSREESESFGVAIIEASSCALPVVVSEVGGLKEVVLNGVTGTTLPKERFDLLARELVRLVLDEESRIQLGLQGRQHVIERYGWEGCVDSMENVYSSVILNRRLQCRLV